MIQITAPAIEDYHQKLGYLITREKELRLVLERILAETRQPFPTTLDGPMRRDGRIAAMAVTALENTGVT